MARPRKNGIPASAVFVYDDTEDDYIAWDGNVDLASGDIATESTLRAVAGFVISPFDYVALTYVTSGAAAGEIETAVYRSGGSSGTIAATLTLSYDSSGRLSSVTRT